MSRLENQNTTCLLQRSQIWKLLSINYAHLISFQTLKAQKHIQCGRRLSKNLHQDE